MANEPRAFFLFGDGGLHVEPTIAQAAAYMEPIDVQNGEYEVVFDEEGRQYRFDVLNGITRLSPTADSDLDALKQRLTEEASVQALGNVDLDDPLTAAAAISRHEWNRRWPRWPRWLSRRLHGDQPRIVE